MNKSYPHSFQRGDQSQEKLARRTHAKKEIDRFFNVAGKTKVIVLDTETNGLSPAYSVLSCSMLKYEIDPATYEISELGRFCRYYFPVENYEPKAIEKNGLTAEVIAAKRQEIVAGKRQDAWYAEHFVEETELALFCDDVIRYIGHNIEFDAQFIPLLQNKIRFCTMKTNTDIVGIEIKKTPKTYFKYPTLEETALFYGIETDASRYHTSDYDAEITARIFIKMLQRARDENFLL